MVTDKKEQGCQGFSHLDQPFSSQVFMCGTSILELVLRRESNVQYDIAIVC